MFYRTTPAFAAIMTIIMFGIATPTLAAPTQDVMTVVKMVTNTSVPSLQRKTFTSPVDGSKSFQAVFVVDGNRYTVYDSPSTQLVPDPMLSLWIRKNGTHSPRALDTLSDYGQDGTANFGIDGPRQHVFNTGDEVEGPRGLDNQVYWQKRYDKAIAALAAYAHRFEK